MPFLKWSYALLIPLACITNVSAEDGLALTRPEMKKRIEALKERTSRLALPAPTPQELASGRSLVNNGRLRSIYLPSSWQSFVITGWGGGSTRPPAGGTANLLKTMEADPSYAFKTRLFWIVSRANDCRYCLGHQELKLKRVGMTDDQIASLDSRWESFPAKEQAAIKATRKLTVTPYLFGEKDIAELKQHFSDAEVIDIIYTVSRYNAVNRWTSATGIPQDQKFGGEAHSELDTPTSPEFASVPSIVIPAEVKPRRPWESRDDVMAVLKQAHNRTPVISLPTMDAARNILAKDCPGATPPAARERACVRRRHRDRAWPAPVRKPPAPRGHGPPDSAQPAPLTSSQEPAEALVERLCEAAREFAAPDVKIHCCTESGELIQTFTLEELLPFSFGPENLG